MKTLQHYSIKHRVIMFTLAVFVVSILSLSFYASRMLQKDMLNQLGGQQYATVSLLVENLSNELSERMSAVKVFSRELRRVEFSDHAALQNHLEHNPVFRNLFNGGAFIVGLDGVAIADIPLSARRVGINYLNRDYVTAALRDGKTTISDVLLGKAAHSPIVAMATPIRDAQGQIVGALVGINNLARPNFLDKISNGHYGATGGYLIVSQRQRVVVSASDTSRIMQPVPGLSGSAGLERFLHGAEGYEVLVNPQGESLLVSAKGIPVADWSVLSILPASEAFAPIRAMQRRILLATLLLSVLSGLLTLWILRRELLPMFVAAKSLAELADSDRPLQALPVTSNNEIGDLVGGFNRLIQSLGEREAELKESEGQVRQLAFFDTLTGLPNRRLLLDRYRQAMASIARSGRSGALMFIDLDNFKTLNDTLGHNFGDLLLQQVARRLESCVREGDTVARLGGDEFLVMLEELSKESREAAAQAEAVGRKIIAVLNQPYQLHTHEFRNTASIGVAIFNEAKQTLDSMMKQADIAMYQSKKSGRNALCFFDPQMQEALNARTYLETELRKAIELQQFELYYQLQLDAGHRPFGAEVLIRWKHPERGMVSPAQFIPIAEETGLILSIGQWVLETACAQLKRWQEDANTRELTLSVNVSARQFHEEGFIAKVQGAVQRHGINPARLKLEPTESILLDAVDGTIATMDALKALGVQFALDDFGTGYSSLQYLKRLPLDQLKIDQSFVRDIDSDTSDRAIICTIIAMAHNMNLSVIAEGVETEAQFQFLKHSGCDQYQGYLFGRPAPIGQFEAQLASRRALNEAAAAVI
jgi:diguanylate cyclase (GGDEF)-like protein